MSEEGRREVRAGLETFPIASITLGPGSYFFAVQAVTSTFGDYLQQGLVTSGAAETNDGGLTWSTGYENSSNRQELGGIFGRCRHDGARAFTLGDDADRLRRPRLRGLAPEIEARGGGDLRR